MPLEPDFGAPDTGQPDLGVPETSTIPLQPPVTVPPTIPAPPEQAPPSGGGGGGLGDAATLALFLIILGLIAAAAYVANIANDFKRFMFGRLPKRVQPPDITPVQATQIISGRLGQAYTGIDAQIATGLAEIEQTASGIGNALVQAERRIHRLAQALATSAGLAATQAGNVSHAQATAHTASQSAAQASAAAAAETARAKHAEAHLQQQVTAEPSYVHRLLEPELDALRHRVHTLERGAASTWDEIEKHEELFGAAAVTAAVGFGLNRLGGGWIRCEANQLLGKAACEAGPDAASNLLSLLVAGGVLLNLREFVKLEQAVVRPTTEVVAGLLGVAFHA